jgi:hypothetical protein
VGKEKKLLKKKISEKNFAQSNFDHKKKLNLISITSTQGG